VTASNLSKFKNKLYQSQMKRQHSRQTSYLSRCDKTWLNAETCTKWLFYTAC